MNEMEFMDQLTSIDRLRSIKKSEKHEKQEREYLRPGYPGGRHGSVNSSGVFARGNEKLIRV